ncbi:response regulator [Novosphingobium pentaromativorans]|uniref:Regulatory protein VirG n=1 Tax=Novosphingobium pentaromativorans US6-1 TaxID=1088721 RepID=G6EH49_9SPHN|nr:response regulator transcription factor [Novosphingobium pentaromativorans]AIT81973.1 chemotaxis protein CheY [Novosphingobium pentaromativorans US6-1]EHJ59338.1 two component transcriptional regulator, winged helix family [Novosphingobium pentaromativorans US6-1]
MSDAPLIYVCDDEADLRDMVAEYLARHGLEVAQAGCGDELRALIAEQRPDLILLDINMPGEDGLSVLRSLQANDAPHVIMLTAAGETVDRIVGLEMGADDYLGKPVDLRELVARVRAVLRRKGSADRLPERAGGKNRFAFGKCTLDLEAAKLFDGEGNALPLTAMEFNLLKLFARNKGHVLNRDQILEGAHDRAWEPFDRSIDIRISRIRKKIEVNPEKPTVIRTVRGIGYIYDPG